MSLGNDSYALLSEATRVIASALLLLRPRRRKSNRTPATSARSTMTPTPAPIAAVASVEGPLDEDCCELHEDCVNVAVAAPVVDVVSGDGVAVGVDVGV